MSGQQPQMWITGLLRPPSKSWDGMSTGWDKSVHCDDNSNVSSCRKQNPAAKQRGSQGFTCACHVCVAPRSR